MADRIKTELRDAILEHLRVKANGQTVSAEDDARMDKIMDDTHEKLVDRGLAYWELTAIPQAVFRPVVRYMAGEAASPMGLSAERVTEYEVKSDVAEADIRRHNATKDSGEPVKAVYY